jgi:hypothetical protein
VKSFRIYFTERPDPPEKTVEDYTPEELQRFLEGFRATRQRWERCRFWLFVVCVPGILILAAGRLLSLHKQELFEWTMAWIIFLLTMVAAIAIVGSIRCPACRNKLNGPIGDYCRKCGAKSLEQRTWPKNQSCSACGKSFERGSQHPLAKFRFCTVCGVKLDDTTT